MKNKDICAIVIPVYKEQIDQYEELSFRQCLAILCRYPIYLLAPDNLPLSTYEIIATDYSVQLNKAFFDKSIFTSIAGYNRLMKNKLFYWSFSAYKYILIYQLDAFVFRDELEYWCMKGYDYIGAPWFDNYDEKQDNTDLWRVGNGGFSLRKVSYFRKVLSWKLPLKKMHIWPIYKKSGLVKLRHFLSRENRVKFYLDPEHCTLNEDVFFTVFMQDTFIPPRLPSPEEAAFFSFEKSPSFLFQLCNNKLPFGCHAYLKYEYNEFWKQYIDHKGVPL